MPFLLCTYFVAIFDDGSGALLSSPTSPLPTTDLRYALRRRVYVDGFSDMLYVNSFYLYISSRVVNPGELEGRDTPDSGQRGSWECPRRSLRGGVARKVVDG